MKAFVFTDQALTSRAGQFVWLAIDTDKAVNAPVLAKFPVGAWPSFYIVDPRSEALLVRWTGGGTVGQMESLLDAGRQAWKPAAEGLARQLAEADRLNGAGQYEQAASAYGSLIAKAPPGWKEFPRVADARLFALIKADQNRECAEASLAYYPRVAGGPSAMSVAGSGIDCAVEIDETDPDRGALIARAEANGRAALADPKVQVAVDDRSGLYISLIGAREDQGDEAGKKALVGDWIRLLENAAARAPDAAARMVFDSHRLSAYLEAGEPERAVPMLEASERDAPADYNPPARLAVAFNAMKQYDKALDATERALSRAYGPRRLVVWRARADAFEGKGDRESALRALARAIAEAEALPAGQRSERAIAAFRARIEKLSSTPAS